MAVVRKSTKVPSDNDYVDHPWFAGQYLITEVDSSTTILPRLRTASPLRCIEIPRPSTFFTDSTNADFTQEKTMRELRTIKINILIV